MFHRFARVLTSVVVILAFAPTHSSGQVQSNSGKSWKVGNASSTNFVQLTVSSGQSSQISGTISVRSRGLWQGTRIKKFSGIQQNVLNLKKISCSCEDGMNFYGWYWPGSSSGRADDVMALYLRSTAIPSDTEPECHPDVKIMATEAETEPVE